jgi:hypothetical protein
MGLRYLVGDHVGKHGANASRWNFEIEPFIF